MVISSLSAMGKGLVAGEIMSCRRATGLGLALAWPGPGPAGPGPAQPGPRIGSWPMPGLVWVLRLYQKSTDKASCSWIGGWGEGAEGGGDRT